MNTDKNSRKNGRPKARSRYQNLMLVGDQGEVIPFRRFKLMAYGLVVALIVSLILVAVLGVLLTIHRTKINSQKSALKEAQQQLVKLRDEKDLLLTQIVINKKRNGPPTSDKKTALSEPVAAVSKTEMPKPKEAPVATAEAPKPAPPKSPTPAKVKLGADARRIKVSYQSDRQMLGLSFRVYNTSKPKRPLAGRTVVVFKNQDEPPIQWLAVPRVQLVDGKPSGKRGKAFKINNYRTESFKAFRQKPPVRFNMATIYIYSSNGELLLSKDYSFKIKVQPPPKPIIPAPKPVQEKRDKPKAPTPTPAPVKPVSEPAPSPSPPVPVDPAGSSAVEDIPSSDFPATSDPKPQNPESSSGTAAPQTDIQINPEETPNSENLNIDGPQSPPTPIQNKPTTQGEQR